MTTATPPAGPLLDAKTVRLMQFARCLDLALPLRCLGFDLLPALLTGGGTRPVTRRALEQGKQRGEEQQLLEHMVDIREVMDLFELNRTLRSELEARTVKDAELMRLPACCLATLAE